MLSMILTLSLTIPVEAHHKANHRGPTPSPEVTPTPTPVETPPPPTGFVGRSGTSLRLNGSNYFFTGLNIYNANSRWNCWYPLGYNDTALENSLSDIGAGKEAFRAWFFQGLATTNGARDWAAFDHTLNVASAANQKVIIVLTGEGGCGDTALHLESWYNTGYKTLIQGEHTTTYRSYVQEIVNRYKDNPTVLMWQIGNELEIKIDSNTCGSHTILKSFVDDIASLIKSIDTNHLVSVGTIGTGQCGAQGSTQYKALHSSTFVDLCEFHDYIPGAMPGDEFNGLQTRINDCNSLNKPMFVGEVGIPYSVGLTNRANQFEDKRVAQFNAGIVGLVAWDWRAAGYTDGDAYVIGPNDPALEVLGR